jgi:hypothetical protein
MRPPNKNRVLLVQQARYWNSGEDTFWGDTLQAVEEGEPSQEIAQLLMDDFYFGDFNFNGTLRFQEAPGVLGNLRQAQFNALDANGNGELSQAELELVGAVPPSSGGGGCFKKSNSSRIFTDLKDLFGDLFLLGLLSFVLIAWRGFGVRPQIEER